MNTALITGASRGLGLALTTTLSERGWRVVVDARSAAQLQAATGSLPGVVALPGDVTAESHRHDLIAAAGDRLDLLVLNASSLGQSPLPPMASYDLAALRQTLETNTVAPLRLIQLALPAIRRAGGIIAGISSDAAVEPYSGWGGYGASKAALDQVLQVLAAEEPALRIYAVDPGDMRTAMHAEAFPGEDISDRPLPAVVVPALLDLFAGWLPSGRYAADTIPIRVAPAGAVE